MTGEPPPPARRPLWTAVILLAGAAVALLVSARLSWDLLHPDEFPVGVQHEVGSEVKRPLVPLAVLALAAIAGTVAVGGWPRRLLGAVLVVVGFGVIWYDAKAGVPAQVSAFDLAAGRVLALLAGILFVVAGVLVVGYGARMPRLGAAYVRRRSSDPDKEMWQSLSEGEDPTTDEP